MNVGDRDSGPGPSGAPSTSPPLADAVTHASHRVEGRITEDARRSRRSDAGGGGGVSGGAEEAPEHPRDAKQERERERHELAERGERRAEPCDHRSAERDESVPQNLSRSSG